MEDDVVSFFTYENSEAEPDSFSLKILTSVATRWFAPKKCTLEKIAQGGFHKVYNVTATDGEELEVVARVASPAFPKDKLESEVATMRYISEKTSVPVPKVIAWNSDATNEVGAEYIFLSKIPGVPAIDFWSEISMDAKKNMVRQVAKHMLELWKLRFDALGSLYLADNDTGYKIGPIISARFYKKLDGMPRTKIPIDLSEYRGPFSSVPSYLASEFRADLKLYAERREDLIIEADGKEEHVESGKRAMEMALELCEIYPGGRPISDDAREPITLALYDFTLSNIMINPATGDVNGLIDFESATTAPGWFCADIPPWLCDEDIELAEYFASVRDDRSDQESNNGDSESESATSNEESDNSDEESGTSDEESNDSNEYSNTLVNGIKKTRLPCAEELENIRSRPPTEDAILQKEFLATMKNLDESGTWTRAYERGKPYREFATNVGFFITWWGSLSRGRWVDSALRWLKRHPDEDMPGNVEFRYPDIVNSWK